MRRTSLTERIIIILFLGGFYFFLAWTCAEGADVPSPLAEIKDTVEELKKIVSDPSLQGDAKRIERQNKIRELLLNRMDMEDMCKRSLGRHWRTRTDAERIEYVKACSQYVEALHGKMVFETVEFVESVGIRHLKERLDAEFAEVDVVVESSPEDTKVTFKLHLVGGHWKAYDVVVANISLVQNLRSQFDTIIRKNSFEKLLEELRKRS